MPSVPLLARLPFGCALCGSLDALRLEGSGAKHAGAAVRTHTLRCLTPAIGVKRTLTDNARQLDREIGFPGHKIAAFCPPSGEGKGASKEMRCGDTMARSPARY